MIRRFVTGHDFTACRKTQRERQEVSGHEFTRADKANRTTWALAPAACFLRIRSAFVRFSGTGCPTACPELVDRVPRLWAPGMPQTSPNRSERRWAANPRLPHRRWSVIVRAAQVIPALRANQLAMVASQPMRTVGANLRVMVRLRPIWRRRAARRTGM